MDEFLHTLTAYHLVFSYMKRNNILKEELSDKIKNNEVPNISLNKLLNEMIKLSNELDSESLSKKGKVVLLNKIEDIEYTDQGFKRIFVVPHSGKRDIPIRIVNLKEKNEQFDLNENYASIYRNNLFFYEKSGEYYCICHRFGGSSCKTLLCSVLNRILKKYGIKLEMNWIPPLSISKDNSTIYDIDKITLICEERKSSDIADMPKKKEKRISIKELTLNLNRGFRNISTILNRYQLKEITKEDAFLQIKDELNERDYNSASLFIKIGKSHKKVDWDDFEGLIDGFDVTDKVKDAGPYFIPTLKKCSDDFLLKLLEEQ